MRIGVAYYPEHWNSSLWTKDAELMAAAGVSLVRLGEGAWGKLEPAEGQFDFGWMDEAIEALHQNNLHVIMGTPTYAPPTWLCESTPEILIRDVHGHTRYPGARMHRCVNSPAMRRRAEAIVWAMADHYCDNPAVFAWQIDNEFELSMCTCDACAEGFRSWLRVKYDTLSALNEAWGTAFWSGQYHDWSAIHPPLGGSKQLNPSYQLDYYRFQNDSIGEFKALQERILRERCPNHYITHNTWESPNPLAYAEWFKTLDVVGVDYYPIVGSDRLIPSTMHGDFFLDRARGIKRQNFWVLEQLTGSPIGCWSPMDRTAPPGAMRALAWQSVARGADAVCFFTWRSPLYGAEQLGGGLIGHDNAPGLRYGEFEDFCQEINRLCPHLEGTTLWNDVALLYLPEQARAFQIQPHTDPAIDYEKIVECHHQALNRMGVGTDVLSSLEGLQYYKVVIAPLLFMVDDAMAATLTEYVEAGGQLILTYRSGVKNLQNVNHAMPLPGPLAELAGVTVEDWDPIGNEGHRVEAESGDSYTAYGWADILIPTSARPIASYCENWFSNRAAATVNEYGRGKTYYLGAGLGSDYLRELYYQIAEEVGLSFFPDVPEGIHTSIRERDGAAYRFVLNLTNETQEVRVMIPRQSMLSGYMVEETLVMEPFGVEILALQ